MNVQHGSITTAVISVFVSVIGDVMGSALTNLNNLLKMPYGCGEQNMINFAPNIYVLKYLEAKGLDTPDVRKKAIGHIKSGKSGKSTCNLVNEETLASTCTIFDRH